MIIIRLLQHRCHTRCASSHAWSYIPTYVASFCNGATSGRWPCSPATCPEQSKRPALRLRSPVAASPLSQLVHCLSFRFSKILVCATGPPEPNWQLYLCWRHEREHDSRCFLLLTNNAKTLIFQVLVVSAPSPLGLHIHLSLAWCCDRWYQTRANLGNLLPFIYNKGSHFTTLMEVWCMVGGRMLGAVDW
jgi:hypothetical protein